MSSSVSASFPSASVVAVGRVAVVVAVVVVVVVVPDTLKFILRGVANVVATVVFIKSVLFKIITVNNTITLKRSSA